VKEVSFPTEILRSFPQGGQNPDDVMPMFAPAASPDKSIVAIVLPLMLTISDGVTTVH
jgi:hypothetical protein